MKKKSEKKSRNNPKTILPIVGLIVLVIALIAAFVFIVIEFTSPKMQEINTDSEIIGIPMQRYFYDEEGGCLEYNEILLRNEKLTPEKLSTEQKEAVTINFLIGQSYNGYSYDYINKIYQIFFGNDESIAEKDLYETANGVLQRNEGGGYVIRKTCAEPEIYTCVALDKAYKSEKNDILKVVVGVFTITSENGNVYSGLKHEGDTLGIRDEFKIDDKLGELPKWELTFKIDKSSGLYQLASTEKIS